MISIQRDPIRIEHQQQEVEILQFLENVQQDIGQITQQLAALSTALGKLHQHLKKAGAVHIHLHMTHEEYARLEKLSAPLKGPLVAQMVSKLTAVPSAPPPVVTPASATPEPTVRTTRSPAAGQTPQAEGMSTAKPRKCPRCQSPLPPDDPLGGTGFREMQCQQCGFKFVLKPKSNI